MTKTVLTFGLLSGAVATALSFMTLPFAEQIGFDRSIFVGYTIIVISMLFVYFGVRAYRDNALGGQITFGAAFRAGLLITIVSSMCYVAGWLVMYYNFLPDFGDKYAAYVVESARTSGASEAELAAKVKEGQDMIAMLENPLINAAVTFIEPFPVGLLITLVSAAVLKKQERG